MWDLRSQKKDQVTSFHNNMDKKPSDFKISTDEINETSDGTARGFPSYGGAEE